MTTQRRGIGLIEVVVGISIIFVGILTLTNTFGSFIKYDISNSKNVQAGLLLEEGFEVVKFLRDSSWSINIASTTQAEDYYLSFNGASWSLSTTPSSIDSTFYRTIEFAPISRDSNQDIVVSGGTNDPNTKLVTVRVSFSTTSGTSTKEASTYITNLFAN